MGEGKYMNIWHIISWIGAFTAIIAYIFNIRKNKICFILWEIAAILFIISNIYGNLDYGQATLNTFYLGMNAYGWYKWRKDERI